MFVWSVEPIMENPIHFSSKLIKIQEDETKSDDESKKNVFSEESLPRETNQSTLETKGEGKKEIPRKSNYGFPSMMEMSASSALKTGTTPSVPSGLEKNVSGCLQRIDRCRHTQLRLEEMDPLERSLVNDLREIDNNNKIPVERLPRLFAISWDRAYYKVLISSERYETPCAAWT